MIGQAGIVNKKHSERYESGNGIRITPVSLLLCFPMRETLVLSNPVTGTTSFQVSSFEDDSTFNQLSSFNHFTVLLVSHGQGCLTADTSEYLFRPGSLMSFSLYQPFRIVADGDLKGHFLAFHPDFFCLHQHRAEVSCNGVLFNNIYESPLVGLEEEDQVEMTRLFTGLLSEMRRKDVDTEVLLSYLKILLINGTRIKIEQRNVGNGAGVRIPEKLIALQAAIEANFRSLHNAAAYADLLNHSQGALNKACKEFFNKTLTELITDRIILEAKRELYLTSKPVKAIAYEIGFSDEFHFSRYFKRNIGISPQHFRDTVGVGKATAA
jgi:AraC family transcriptional activator of pobA